MELLQIENLSFVYPTSNEKALDNVSLNIESGSFNLIMGESGSGKTTLLKMIKRDAAPYGQKSGEIVYGGMSIDALSERTVVSEIGLVRQNPDDGIVTDKVWHELAFGLENLGVEKSIIRRRVAEMASYFGIEGWYDSNTYELSGGQKQILNLASVMVMKPKLLLLDEPTGQLDPIAASEFIATLQKLNRELGLTVIISEHRLEEVFPIADKVIVMENGCVQFADTPQVVAAQLKEHKLSSALPSAVRIYNALSVKAQCPLTVREGRAFLENNFSDKKGARTAVETRERGEIVLEAEDISFRYGRALPDVVSHCSLEIGRGEVFSLLGGNGSGKTTMLSLLSGLERPYRGRCRVFGKKLSEYKDNSLYRRCLSLLPQNPGSLFIHNTVGEDLAQLSKLVGENGEKADEKLSQAVEMLGIGELLERHPADLSGGELQRCAMAKLLLAQPEILLLDEPTKGMDPLSKRRFANVLQELKNEGKTVLIVTHDIEFAAQVSDRCALLFNGSIVSEGAPNEFFSGNTFYTTAASRIAAGFFENTVLCEEIAELCK